MTEQEWCTIDKKTLRARQRERDGESGEGRWGEKGWTKKEERVDWLIRSECYTTCIIFAVLGRRRQRARVSHARVRVELRVLLCASVWWNTLTKCKCVCQDPKLRDVLGFGKESVEGKLITVVCGNDLVNISFLNFQAMQEDIAKVTMETEIL